MILEAAAQVFEARGYAGGTTNHVAARAGVSIGTLYQYFEDKDALLYALMEAHLAESVALLAERLGDALVAAASGTLDLEDTLRHLVEAVIALHEATPRLHRVLFEEVPWPSEMWDRLKGMERELAGQVEMLLRTMPEVTVEHADRAAWMVVQLVETLTHRYVLDPPPWLQREDFATELVVMLRGYLAGCGASEGLAARQGE